jgi:ELWxxDGT repeat protein
LPADALYFQANDGKSGAELWRVTGGAPSQVQDLAKGPDGSAPHAFAVFKNALYFAASTKPIGEELFRYDGSSISLAAEMTAGPDGGEIAALTDYAGALYFTRYSSSAGRQVWRFNGSTAELVPAIDGISGWVDHGDLIEQPFVVFKHRERPVMPGAFAARRGAAASTSLLCSVRLQADVQRSGRSRDTTNE